MKRLYIECGMGAAGDMLGGALLDLFEDRDQMVGELNSLGVPDVVYSAETTEKCGIRGTHLRVKANGMEENEHMHDLPGNAEHTHEHNGVTHSHSSLHGIEHIVKDHLTVNDRVKEQILAVYQILADAESSVHGVPADEIHFHEVGTLDAVADITAVCYLLDRLGTCEITASPVHVGRGTVKCAHGILPVPAPATARILQGIPVYSKEQIEGELCTPTGAALLKHFASSFGPMPVSAWETIGYGMGTKDFAAANCVRIFLCAKTAKEQEVSELNFNVDDMTGEEIGFLTSCLLENGAYEVFTTPVQMKKTRPGTLVTVLCDPEDRIRLGTLIFRNSTTLGIRHREYNRMILERRVETEDTVYGPVRRKTAEGYGVCRSKYEYDDLAEAARKNGISVREVLAELNRNK